MSAHKNDDCTGRWWFLSRNGGAQNAECDKCHANYPADTVEAMRPFIEENYHGLLLVCAEKGL